jgi:transposase
MRPKGSAVELERRRRGAVEAIQQGESPTTVSRILNVSQSSVFRWLEMAEEGATGLAAKPYPPRQLRLSDEQLQQLEHLLSKGATAHGWPNDLWTAARVQEVIQRHFGEEFHVEHVRCMLKKRLNWSSQRPEQRARERDEEEIERWVQKEVPRLKKRSRGQERAYCLAG